MSMSLPERYDAIVIGAGQAGGPLAIALARSGRRTALIERKHVGGTCVNEGCTPTKTMVASARVAYLARRGADYGVNTGAVTVDMARVRARKRAIVESFRSGNLRRVEATAGLELICGEARFTGPRELAVGGRALTADLVFINSGGRPARPDVAGLDRVASLDSTSIMELDHLPEHLLVVGGGYVGLEFGQMFRRFGSRVTVAARGPQLLEHEDEDVADAVLGVLREDGVEVLLNAEACRAEPRPGGGARLTLRLPAGERIVEGSHLLLATGRVPNTDRLDLPSAGVATDATRLRHRQPAARDLRAGRLRARRRERRTGVHPHLVRRFSDHPRQSAGRRERVHHRAAGPLHGLHRSAARAHRIEREGGAWPRTGVPGGPDADEPRGPRARGG